MKKEYINPILKETVINEEPLLVAVSTGEGNPNIDVDDDEGGDVNDALGKSFWDE